MDINTIKPLEDVVNINWRIINHCNYDCEYCPSDYHDKTYIIKNTDHYINVILPLIKKIKTNTDKPIHLFIDGGEPTRLPGLKEVCKQSKYVDPNIRITIASNGSQSLQYYKDLAQHVDNYTFSMHFHLIKIKPFVKKVVELSRVLGKDVVCCQIMAEIDYFNECKKVAAFFEKYAIWFNILSINYENSNSETLGKNILYDKEYRDFIDSYMKSDSVKYDMLVDGVATNSSAFKNMTRKQGSVYGYKPGLFKGWHCHVTSDLYWIERDVIHGGTCGIVKYGHAHKDSFQIVDSVICDGRACNCSTSLRVKKYKTNLPVSSF